MAIELERGDERIAYATLRIVAGVNIMMHGISRLITGSGEFAAKTAMQFAHTPLPPWSVWAFGLTLPPIESILGLLLLIGLRTRAVLIGASLLIAVLTFGSALAQDWTAAGIQLNYALVYAALIFLRRHNGWSVDSWMQRS
jgi:thiosulfate dehydrogenase (quinone) large subunit